jgi:hypothetical protein
VPGLSICLRVSGCLPVCLFQVSLPMASIPDRTVTLHWQVSCIPGKLRQTRSLSLGPGPRPEPGPESVGGKSPGSAFSAGDGGVRWPWHRPKLRDHGPFRQTRTMGSASAVDRVGTEILGHNSWNMTATDNVQTLLSRHKSVSTPLTIAMGQLLSHDIYALFILELSRLCKSYFE